MTVQQPAGSGKVLKLADREIIMSRNPPSVDGGFLMSVVSILIIFMLLANALYEGGIYEDYKRNGTAGGKSNRDAV